MKRAPVWLGVILVVAGAIGWIANNTLFRNEFPFFASDSDHFKYGSIGNDSENGLPYLVWRALPSICPDLLPGPGGYASLGFVWEPGHSKDDAPVGISRARVGFERAAINCAFCHHTVVRNANASPVIYPGGPSNLILMCRAISGFSRTTLLTRASRPTPCFKQSRKALHCLLSTDAVEKLLAVSGSVPTIADLLTPVEERPKAFVRATTVLDNDKIGFRVDPCIPGQKIASGYCFDTTETGNAPSGHTYGTALSSQDKDALIAYLKTL